MNQAIIIWVLIKVTINILKNNCTYYIMKKTEAQLIKQRANSAKWYKKNRTNKLVYQKKYALENIYGISEKKHESLLKKQKYKCAVCFEPDTPEKRLHTDHSHITGLVRGLLCGHCNRALGLLLDSPTLIGRLLGYIRTTDLYPKKGAKHLKELVKFNKKIKKGKKVVDRDMIKVQNNFVAELTKKINENRNHKQKGTLEDFI